MLRGTFIALPLVICLCWIFLFLFSKHKVRILFLILAWMFAASFLIFFGYAILLYQAIGVFVYYQYFLILSALSIYPLLFTYVESLTDVSIHRRKIFYRLTPALLLTLTLLAISPFIGQEEMKAFVRVMYLQQNEEVEFSKAGNIRIVLFYVNHIIFYLQAIFYTYFIIRKILIFRKWIIRYKIYARDKKLYLLHVFNFIILLTLLTGLLTFASDISHNNLPDKQLIVASIILSLILISVGIFGIRMFFSTKDFPREIFLLPNNSKYIPLEQAQEIIEMHKEGLLKERILELFNENKIYKNPELRISDISNMLNTNRTYISKTINHNIGSNFSDFVNSYRIGHAKELILESKMETMSLVEIAEKSGFSNMNSFYRAFRRLEGISPKQFLIQEMVSNLAEKKQL